MIRVSQDLLLAPVQGEALHLPVIGYQNIVTASGIVADTEEANNPASNLANPDTYTYWKGEDTSEQYVTITAGEIDETDYVGIARPNFGSAGIAVSLEGQAEEEGEWTELVAPFIPADDDPILLRYTPQALYARRIKMASGDLPPEMGVVRAGKLLVMQRGLQAPHVPLPYGRVVEVSNGRSESGAYLGRIVTGEYVESSAVWSLLNKEWARVNVFPFLRSAVESPFFFAWWPSQYPKDVGYAVLTNDPRPSYDTGVYVSLALEMRGVV